MKKIQHGGYSVGIMTALPSSFLKSHVIWKLVKKKKKNLIQKMVFNWQYLYKLGQIYKTSLEWIQSFEDASFLGPPCPILGN